MTDSVVNADTVNLAPTEAMQFGNALRRILFQIYRADPRWGPVYAKADISDGFYNITVSANGTKQFGIVLPAAPGQEPLILFFLGLPMGWVSSPPVFCAGTESATDLAKAKMKTSWRPPPHRQEEPAETPTPGGRPPSLQGRPPPNPSSADWAAGKCRLLRRRLHAALSGRKAPAKTLTQDSLPLH